MLRVYSSIGKDAISSCSEVICKGKTVFLKKASNLDFQSNKNQTKPKKANDTYICYAGSPDLDSRPRVRLTSKDTEENDIDLDFIGVRNIRWQVSHMNTKHIFPLSFSVIDFLHTSMVWKILDTITAFLALWWHLYPQALI